MTKAHYNVLIVTYSQTGQLDRVVDTVVAPLVDDATVTVDRLRLKPQPDYPFPWPFFRFLDTFPECVQSIPPPLAPLEIDHHRDYDLIVLGYTVWFLSPSLPVTAFLQSQCAHRVLRDRPVVTLVACRNMWVSAQQRVGEALAAAGARLSDHIAFVDAGSSLASLMTTPRWMLTGRRERWLGLPPAGIDETDREQRGGHLGRALHQALLEGKIDGRQPVLTGLGAVQVDEGLVVSERIGLRSFRIWSRLIRAVGRPGSRARQLVLSVYLLFLLGMIVTVVPLSLLLRRLLRPLFASRLAALRALHEQPSGSGQERIERPE